VPTPVRRARNTVAGRAESQPDDPGGPRLHRLQGERERALETAHNDLVTARELEAEAPDPGVQYALHIARAIVAQRRGDPRGTAQAQRDAIGLDPKAIAAYVLLIPALKKDQLDDALAELTEQSS
jgi:hypothetical protein